MGHDVQTEPAMLNYASAQRSRRLSSIDMMLVILATLNLFVFATRYILPRVTSVHESDSISLASVKVRSLKSTFALYHLHVGAYPTSLDDLVVRPSGETGAGWKGPYVEDPGTLRDAWGRPLRYKAPGIKNLGRYDLWSVGKDGVDGTADDIKNW